MRSLVEYFAGHEGYKCGYCKRLDTNFNHGLWAHALTVNDYQDLIDRGWRRSGKYCYKPTMDVTCCPMYTIRCRTEEFKATKSQKKIMKRINKFLSGLDEVSQTERKMSTCSSGSDTLGDGYEEGVEQFVETVREQQNINIDSFKNSEALTSCDENVEDKINTQESNVSKVQQAEPVNVPKVIKKDTGPDPNKAPCKKAKVLRRERKLEKLHEKGIDVIPMNNCKNKEKQIEDFINELPTDCKRKLEIKLVRTTPPSPEWLATSKVTHLLYVKYQTTIHNELPEKCTEPKFRDFLVQSPLEAEYREDGPPCGYGSFHQQYWLDGTLIAVGVIDILPKCVSSVYFFYDPQYMNLSLGIYGALREIAFTRQLTTICPDIQYYYMGFYIHSCLKMRYKGNFYPSDLLCPETYKWFSLKECIPKMEVSPYSRLDPDLDSIDENCPKENDYYNIPVWANKVIMFYKNYKKQYASKKYCRNDVEVKEYVSLVGAKSAKSLILVRPYH